jgi:hypothetical protein
VTGEHLAGYGLLACAAVLFVVLWVTVSVPRWETASAVLCALTIVLVFVGVLLVTSAGDAS